MRPFVVYSVCIFVSVLLSLWACGQTSYDHEKIDVHRNNDSQVLMGIDQIYQDDWHTLPQIEFWKKIMLLSPDSCLINIASYREILETQSFVQWMQQDEEEKQHYKDSLRTIYRIDSTELLYVTSGKRDFYRFEDVYSMLSKGVESFERYGVDPWYAQAILLIESPGQLKKSPAGAYGPFQLMPKVARKQGLIVDESTDERTEFDKSAYASARLIQRVCIPETKNMLGKFKIPYKDTDLWFRLLVLHVYHAGATNVGAALNTINPVHGGQDLILTLWQTKAANFKNSSQNYSQIALAALLTLDDLIREDSNDIYSCQTSKNVPTE